MKALTRKESREQLAFLMALQKLDRVLNGKEGTTNDSLASYSGLA